MNELSSETRALLDLARDGAHPTRSDRRRVRQALMASLGGGAALASSTTGAAAAAVKTAAVGGGSLVGKSLVGLVVGAGLGLAVAVPVSKLVSNGSALELGQTDTSSMAQAAAGISSASARATGAAASVAGSAQPAPLGTTAEPPREPQLAPVSGLRNPTKPREPSAALGAELDLLSQAQRELAAGRAGQALNLLDEHARRFGAGALSQERDAARVVALCQLGRGDEARQLGRRFLERAPNSPLAQRVARACRSGAE